MNKKEYTFDVFIKISILIGVIIIALILTYHLLYLPFSKDIYAKKREKFVKCVLRELEKSSGSSHSFSKEDMRKKLEEDRERLVKCCKESGLPLNKDTMMLHAQTAYEYYNRIYKLFVGN